MYIYIRTYNLKGVAPNSCHLLPRIAVLCAREVQFGQQLMLKSVNAWGCQIEVPPFIDVGLVLGSLGHFVVPCLCTCMRVWTSLSLFLVTNLELQKTSQFGLQIDSVLTQVSAPGDLSPPPESRRFPGILKNDFCSNLN